MLIRDLSLERWRQIDALFAQALERPPAERQRFLRETTGDDAELAREVQLLLDDTTDAEAALGDSVSRYGDPVLSSLLSNLQDDYGLSTPSGGRIGPYRIRSELGRGGMGTVYLAERADEVFEKLVAVKVVKRGMDTDEVLHRFRYERQILASLEHPNIARLYDGGATEDGRPYLVMEHIHGQPITTFCDDRRLTVDARLHLFETICKAVQYAHRNLVIHRDIKPSNILVGADGTVKLLDFGIAKLLDASDSDTAPQTRADARLVTPAYASPEQLSGKPVTTASDVYALGVVLYELLTGRRPTERPVRPDSLDKKPGATPGIERPSVVVGRAGPAGEREAAPPAPEEIASRRGTSPPALRRSLAGDLDTIILRALAEEPERRYQSAEQLLADIKRHLNGLPVLARGDSALYRARKFVRRHRVGVGFSAALGLLAAVFATTALAQAREVARARTVAEDLLGQAENLISHMLGDFRTKLDALGRLDLLEDVASQALGYFAAVPPDLLVDEVLFIRSDALRFLGEVERAKGDREAAGHAIDESFVLAEALVRRDSLNPEWQLGLARSYGWLGVLRYEQGDGEGAREYLQIYRRITEQLVEQAPDSLTYRLELSKALHNIGHYARSMGDLELALATFGQVLEQRRSLVQLDPGNVEFLSALASAHNNVAAIHTANGDFASALDNHRAELSIRQDVVARDPNNAPELNHLAHAHGYVAEFAVATGADDEGLRQNVSAMQIYETLVAFDSTNAMWQLGLSSAARLAGVGLLRSGEQDAALVALERSRTLALDLFARDSGRVDHRLELSKAESEVAAAYRVSGRPELAPAAARRALAAIELVRTRRPDDPASRRVESDAWLELGRALARLGRAAEAEDAWQRALAAIRPAAEASGSTPHLSTLGFVLLHLNELDEARAVVDTLVQRGYRRSDFLALAREKGVLSAEEVATLTVGATTTPDR